MSARPGGDEFPVLASNTYKARWKQWHHEFDPLTAPLSHWFN
ncbi:hypothetical protein ACLK1S_07985 [Escherichia coli]